MRKGFDGLSGIVRNEMSRDPQDGSVYLFINRNRDRLKILVWREGGFVLYYKRLESGTYELPGSVQINKVVHINWESLMLIIRGIRLEKISRKKRYVRAI
jgi:Transposase and inactivated derivatives